MENCDPIVGYDMEDGWVFHVTCVECVPDWIRNCSCRDEERDVNGVCQVGCNTDYNLRPIPASNAEGLTCDGCDQPLLRRVS